MVAYINRQLHGRLDFHMATALKPHVKGFISIGYACGTTIEFRCDAIACNLLMKTAKLRPKNRHCYCTMLLFISDLHRYALW